MEGGKGRTWMPPKGLDDAVFERGFFLSDSAILASLSKRIPSTIETALRRPSVRSYVREGGGSERTFVDDEHLDPLPLGIGVPVLLDVGNQLLDTARPDPDTRKRVNRLSTNVARRHARRGRDGDGVGVGFVLALEGRDDFAEKDGFARSCARSLSVPARERGGEERRTGRPGEEDVLPVLDDQLVNRLLFGTQDDLLLDIHRFAHQQPPCTARCVPDA